MHAVLACALVAVGIGNIAIPGMVPGLSRLYLPASLFVALTFIVLSLDRVLANLRHPVLLVTLSLSFGAGFLVAPLNSYGQTKLLALVIMMILLVAPSAFSILSPSLSLMVGLVFSVSILTAIGILFIGVPDITGRITLFGLNPIGTARVTGLGVVIAGTIFLYRPSKGKKAVLILVAAAVPCAIATVKTGSRGPLLAIVISLLIAGVLVWRRTPGGGARAVATVISVVAGIVALMNVSTASSRLSSADANGRDLLYMKALEVMSEHPLGIGWGNFYYELPFFSTVNGEERLYPHNIFLEVGVEAGWIALLALLILVFVALKNVAVSASRGDRIAALVLCITIFLLVNASVSSDMVGNRLMWLFLGISLLHFDDTSVERQHATAGIGGGRRASDRYQRQH